MYVGHFVAPSSTVTSRHPMNRYDQSCIVPVAEYQADPLVTPCRKTGLAYISGFCDE